MTKAQALLMVLSIPLSGAISAQELADDASGALDPASIEADIEAALINRVDEARITVGIVAGILTSDGRRYLTRGVGDRESGAPITPDTIFEIGSVTKVFTSLLLAEMVERGDVGFDDPVAKYLPDSVTVPSYEGREITLLDLATHTSGLPRMPPVANPGSFSAVHLYEFLSGFELQWEPGEQVEYSNLGFGLLGHALSLRADMSYEDLLRSRIFEPLGMDSTTITLSDEHLSRMATGYDPALRQRDPEEFDVLEPAGAIRSTADDMLTFAAAQLGLLDHPLRSAMQRMLAFSRPVPSRSSASTERVYLGWGRDGPLLNHLGRTAGYVSMLFVREDAQRAAVVLLTGDPGDDSIAPHAVMPERPLTMFEPMEGPVEIRLSEDVLETYVGSYRAEARRLIEITREGARLFGEVTQFGKTDPVSELGAASETEFFDKNTPALRFSFVKNDAGFVTGLVMHEGRLFSFPFQKVDDTRR